MVLLNTLNYEFLFSKTHNNLKYDFYSRYHLIEIFILRFELFCSHIISTQIERNKLQNGSLNLPRIFFGTVFLSKT